jgi:hypothetical protein
MPASRPHFRAATLRDLWYFGFKLRIAGLIHSRTCRACGFIAPFVVESHVPSELIGVGVEVDTAIAASNVSPLGFEGD